MTLTVCRQPLKACDDLAIHPGFLYGINDGLE